MNRLSIFRKNILSTVTKFKSDTYRDYFERKITFEFDTKKYDNFTEDQLTEVEEMYNRIIVVQNLYFTKKSLFCNQQEKKI